MGSDTQAIPKTREGTPCRSAFPASEERLMPERIARILLQSVAFCATRTARARQTQPLANTDRVVSANARLTTQARSLRGAHEARSTVPEVIAWRPVEVLINNAPSAVIPFT